MADKTKIEWTDATWNPVIGCRRVDEGCRNCYAEVMAARFSDAGQWGHGLANRVKDADGKTDHRWTGETRFIDHALDMPLRWRKPRKIFVCSTSDLFGESVPDEWIDKVFAVMALAPHHTFQVLTKRPERARAYLAKRDTSKAGDPITMAALSISGNGKGGNSQWPLPNVWLGTSISDQASADLRIPHLLSTFAAVRFISAEPLLGPVDLAPYLYAAKMAADTADGQRHQWDIPKLNWVIVGGESGLYARPMHPDWARSLRDQCAAAGTAFFFKQWGENAWVERIEGDPSTLTPYRAGKKAAGARLDGREHKDFPNART